MNHSSCLRAANRVTKSVLILPDHADLLASSSVCINSSRARDLGNNKSSLIVIPTRAHSGLLEDNLVKLPSHYPIAVLASTETDREASHPIWQQQHIVFFTHGYERYSTLSLPTPHPDLAAKRNMGIQLARTIKAEIVVFLDDDICISPGVLSGLTNIQKHLDVVGTGNLGAKDHSLLYSVLAINGLVKPFISANCLAVRSGYEGIFPTIYNEDWFYFYPSLVNGTTSMFGSAVQQARNNHNRYTEERARKEELGDLLAEGFFQCLHDAKSNHVESAHPAANFIPYVYRHITSSEYWSDRIAHRNQLYLHALASSMGAEPTVKRSLYAGLSVLQSLLPDYLATQSESLVNHVLRL